MQMIWLLRRTYSGQTSYARFDHMTSPMVRRNTPRPHLAEPQLIRRVDVPHHVWGDDEGGLVTDRVISSSDQLHVLEFELPPGGRFGHTASNPTLFAADVRHRNAQPNEEATDVGPTSEDAATGGIASEDATDEPAGRDEADGMPARAEAAPGDQSADDPDGAGA